ncbi:MAG: exopolysaccharide biosynthesis polyprenyl glycosylphosphotransferase, partial [Burkholderiaceae bacterium]
MNPSFSRFLTRNPAGFVEVATRWLDLLGGLFGALIVYALINLPLAGDRDWILLVLVNLLITLLCFDQNELYRSWRGRPYSDQFSRLTLAWLVASALTAIVWALLNLQVLVDLPWLLAWFALNLFFIGGQRAMLHLGVRHFRRRGGNLKRVLIYGAGALGQSIVQQIERSPESGFRVIGFLDDNSRLQGQIVLGQPIICMGAELEHILKTHDPDELWIALPLSAMAAVSPVLDQADAAGTSVRLFPDLYGLSLLNHSVSEMLGFPMIDLNIDRMQGLNRTIKEVEDKLLAGGFLLIGLPLIGLIALLIRMESPGPIIFKQRRHGWDGKPFTIYKFRTMRLHQEPDGQLTQAQREDDRFTRMGRWLRRTSLDELPQLVNVLQGRMSMVGPRPHAIEHNEYYRQHIDGYMRRHRVKPGITGWAQIN